MADLATAKVQSEMVQNKQNMLKDKLFDKEQKKLEQIQNRLKNGEGRSRNKLRFTTQDGDKTAKVLFFESDHVKNNNITQMTIPSLMIQE